MAMDQQETFSWMVAELARLRAENERLETQVVAQSLELAQLRVAHLVKKEREGEDIGDLRTMVLRTPADTKRERP